VEVFEMLSPVESQHFAIQGVGFGPASPALLPLAYLTGVGIQDVLLMFVQPVHQGEFVPSAGLYDPDNLLTLAQPLNLLEKGIKLFGSVGEGAQALGVGFLI
jgi:hypothetical protein